MTRRRWWAVRLALLALAVVAGAGKLIVLATHSLESSGSSGASCGVASVPASDVPKVFSKPSAPLVASDPDLARLVAALQRLGTVTDAVPYQGTQWMRSASVPGGFAIWTSGNDVVGFRGSDGRARWGLRQSLNAQAWAVVGSDFVNLELRPKDSVQVAAFAAEGGRRQWCVNVGKPTKQGDPLVVAPGTNGSIWVVTAGPSLTRIDRGSVANQHLVREGDQAAFVQQVDGRLIVGGRQATALALPGSLPTSTAVAALDPQTLRPLWTWGNRVTAHVVGVTGSTIVVERLDQNRLRLVGLGLDGHQRWQTLLPADTTTDMTMRGTQREVVIVRSGSNITGYSAVTGKRLWSESLPGFPLGFDLSTQPNLEGRVLIGSDGAVNLVDPASGQMATYRTPGITAYQATVSGASLLLETNVGAVLVALRPPS